ncbi:N-acetylmuramoyl-L-alanine amidase [Richelia intracellularis HM01]|nr:N-acetylmuramoyl-L-alanine amidase [Richelia intracellularis HM01]
MTSSNLVATPTARLDDWHFFPDRLQLKLNLLGDTQPRHFSLKKPNRIVIDLPNTKLGCVPNKQEFSRAIKSIRLSQFNADVTRVVLDIKLGNILNANYAN